MDGVLGAVLGALEGACWHQWVRERRLLVLWRVARDDAGRPRVDDAGRPAMEALLRVVDLDTGDEVETWPVHVPAGATEVAPKDVIASFEARRVRGFA